MTAEVGVNNFCEPSGNLKVGLEMEKSEFLMEDTKAVSNNLDSLIEVPDDAKLQNVQLPNYRLSADCNSIDTDLELNSGMLKNTHELKLLHTVNGNNEINYQSKDYELPQNFSSQNFLNHEKSEEITFSKHEEHRVNRNHANTRCSDEFIDMECYKNCPGIQKAIDEDIKLKHGCFIRLVDCQVFLNSVMMPLAEDTAKPKKRKLSEGATSRKCKVKKSGNVRQERQDKSKSVLESDRRAGSREKNQQDVLEITNANLNSDEGKNHIKTLSNNDSNIFTNMTSFLLSGTSQEKQEGITFEDRLDKQDDDDDDDDVKKGCQLIVKLFRLPLEKDDTGKEVPETGQEIHHKLDDSSKRSEKFISDDSKTSGDALRKEEDCHTSGDIPKDDRTTKVKERKSSKHEKKKSKVQEKTGHSKGHHSSSSSSKKVKAGEEIKKVQDAIAIKPTTSQGISSVKRIPKINQNSSDSGHSRSLLDRERDDQLEWGTGLLMTAKNQLEDAGWTRSYRHPKGEKSTPSSGGGALPTSRRNCFEDRWNSPHPKSNFAGSKLSPTISERPYRDDRRSFRSYRNGNYPRPDLRSMEKNLTFKDREDFHRSDRPRRPPLLASPQNFSNISSDVQFLLKACNVIVESNSNLSSEHQRQFNMACDRLREELEKLVNSANSTPFNSPGSRTTGNPSLKDLNTDEIMKLLKPHLPHDVYERFYRDITKSGGTSHLMDRLNPISPQSSASSASYKDPALSLCLSPKHFVPKLRDCTDAMKPPIAKVPNSKVDSKLLSEEEKLLRTIEEELKIIETLVRVQDQLSMPEFEKAEDPRPDSPLPSQHPASNPSDNVALLQTPEVKNDEKDSNIASQNLPSQSTKQPEPTDKEKDSEPHQSSEDKDKSKKLMEKIISLSRNALKSYYHKGSITSEEFKCIMKKAITKISESKCKDVSQPKVSRFIDSLVSNVISKRKKINR